MTPFELVQQAEGRKLVNEDGDVDHLKLLPPLGADDLAALETRIPCPLPAEVRELLAYSRGFENGPVKSVDFSGLTDFGMEEIFPCPIPIAHDGFGNYWVVDLTTGSRAWAPILYVCHDPAVIVFQAASLAEFIEELLKLADEVGAPLADYALAWALRHPAVTSTIIGPRVMRHLDGALAALKVKIPDEHAQRIDALVPPGARA